MIVRKAVSGHQAAADVATYAKGVRLMRDRSRANPMDPLGWEYQSRMHGNPAGTERATGEPSDWSECKHGSWFFLPWHRMYLLQFERIIARLTDTPDFALPYWDYPDASSASIPPAFADEQSALYWPARTFQTGPFASPTWPATGTFVAFGGGIEEPRHHGQFPGAVELNPHNPVHGKVGGDMASFQSPLDPLFWIHHCNIDRLWDAWLRLPGRTNPTQVGWSSTSFEFPDAGGGRRRFRVGEVETTTMAGYRYDDAARERLNLMADDAENPRRDDSLELLGAGEAGTMGDLRQIRVEPRAVLARFGLDAERGGPRPLFLRLENTGMEEGDATQMWNVLVRTDAGSDWELVGTIAPFGLAGLTRQGGRQTLTFDVSHLSERILSPGAALEVRFEPAREGVTSAPFYERVAIYTTAG